MTENSPVPPTYQSPGEQPTGAPPPTMKPASSDTPFQRFLDAFAWRKVSGEYEPALYREYEPYARSVKIIVQMLIGIMLGGALLLKVFVDFFHLGIPLLDQNPLEIVGYGLLFSTGVDLAYMLFTDGPDEAIDPLMTGLAAAILLGIGQINYRQIQVQHGLILFLAVGALAGLFAIKKYLYIHPSEKKTEMSKKNELDTGLK